MASGVPKGEFSNAEITQLMRAGLLTSSSVHDSRTNGFSSFSNQSMNQSTSIANISKAASGSVAAAGGEGAVTSAGGRGGICDSEFDLERSVEHQKSALTAQVAEFRISIPGTGPFLKLLEAARSHLLNLIDKSRSKVIPVYLLREKWNGGISADDSAAKAKRYRGEFAGILPARTRKWKQFYGLHFDWILAECLGAGLLEAFDTKSVGLAIRVT